MTYERKEWVNVPDPSIYTQEQLDSFPRFDALNMNRIEEGVSSVFKRKPAYDAHLLNELNPHSVTASQVGAMHSLQRLDGVDILTLVDDGLYYSVNTINHPTDVSAGYVRVECADDNHKIIYWRPYNSQVEYSNVKYAGTWRGWTETLTSKGGILNGDIVVETTADPTIQVRNTSSSRSSAFQQDATGLKIINYNTNDGNDYSAIWLFPKNISGLSRVLQLQEGASESYYVFGQHNKPNGTYTGIYEYEKDTGKRTIDTGGIGDVLFIIGNGCCAFVTSDCSILYAAAHTNGYIVDSKTTYLNGRLTISEKRFEINDLGKTYKWYCL